jgi:hypothetical protein
MKIQALGTRNNIHSRRQETNIHWLRLDLNIKHGDEKQIFIGLGLISYALH